MRKLLGKLGKWLYLKYGSADIVAMTRTQLKVLPVEFDLLLMEPEERRMLAEEAKRYKDDPFLNKVFGMVIKDLKERIVYHANSETELFCDRFSINGVALIQERIEELAMEVEPKDQEFDEFAIT